MEDWKLDTVEAPEFWKSDQNWGSYGLDIQNFLNCLLKSPLHISIQEFTRPEMRSAWGILLNIHCQGHNSLNSGPILKILVPKHISFPRPSILICWTSTWHVSRGQKRVLKIVNEKWKSQKLKKMTFPSSCEQTLGRILDLHKISDLLGQRNDVLQTLASWRKLASKVWPLMTSNDL